MTEWTTVTLAELGLIVTGKTPPTAKEGCFGGDIPFVTPSDMDGQRFIDETVRSLTTEGLRTVAKRPIPAGAILVSCIGSDMGKTHIAGRNCFTNQQINSIAVANPNAHPLYVYYNLSARKEEFQRLAAGSSAQPILNKSSFSRMGISLPPMDMQTVAVELLGSLDDKIELNRRMNETLEAMALAIFRDWFVDFGPTRRKIDGATNPVEVMGGLVADPDRARDLADLFPASLGDDALPDGWGYGPLGDLVANVVERCVPSEATQNRPYIPIDTITARSLIIQDSRPGSEAQSSLVAFRRNDILFGAMRPYFHKVALAHFDGTTRTTVFVLRPKVEADLGFALMTINDETTIEFATQHSSGTTIPYAVWRGSLERMSVLRPPSSVREAYGQIIQPMLDRMFASASQSRTLATTRDLLLPKLMSGEIRLDDAFAQAEVAV